MVMIKKGCVFAVGTPETVMTEENIESVYGIKSRVTKSVLGLPQVTPLVTEVDGNLAAKLPPQIATNYR
jgi:ABC-type cobalamin/Fe3+-siderophores transport system ATPase subunit